MMNSNKRKSFSTDQQSLGINGIGGDDGGFENSSFSNKKKKSKGNRNFQEAPIDVADLANIDETLSTGEESELGVKDNEDQIEWEQHDLSILIANIEKQLPRNDTGKYTTTFEKLDWTTVGFNNHFPEECKKVANVLVKKIRKYRTLTEILADANVWVQNPHRNLTTGRVKHPDKPKKPMTPYLRFYMEKRTKFQADQPELSNTELSKFMATKFASLSEKKRNRYRRKYDAEMAVYKEKMQTFRQEHPDLFKRTNIAPDRVGPVRARRPIDFYLAKRLKKYPEEEKKAAQEKIRATWNSMRDEKKLKWINKAIKDKERYDHEMEEYVTQHPEFKPPKRSNLSKDELELKHKSDGRPEKPPLSGYMLFSKEQFHKLDGPAKENMTTIGKLWKELTDAQRAKYNEKAQKNLSKYSTKFDTYLLNLTQEEREKVLGSKASRKSGKEPAEKKNITKRKIVREKVVQDAAKVAYQMEELNRLKVIHPNKQNGELITTVNKNWDALTEEGKDKYRKLAESIREFLPGKTIETEEMSPKNAEQEEFIRLSGIKRPPKNGFALYCSEKMSTLDTIRPKERMKHIADMWRASSTDRDQYVALAKQRNEEFLAQFKHYKETKELPSTSEGSKKAPNKKAKNIKAEPTTSTTQMPHSNNNNNNNKFSPKPSTSRMSATDFLYKDSSDSD